MRWEYCENCHIDGHCENQDRGHECETYGKRMKDKCERLQRQLDEANTIILLCKKAYIFPEDTMKFLRTYIKKMEIR